MVATSTRGETRSRVLRRSSWLGGLLLLGLGALVLPSHLRVEPNAFPALVSRMVPRLGEGDALQFELLRFDPLRGGRLVLENLRLELEPVSLRFPALSVRPNLGLLLGGRVEPLFTARSFEVVLDARDGPTALVAFYHFLEKAVWPGTHFSLRGGVVRTVTGLKLLERVEIDLQGPHDAPVLALRARQRGGRGQIDVHGQVSSNSGPTRLEVYLDELQAGDVRRWLALATGSEPRRFADQAISALATGRWSVRLGGGEGATHRLDLELEAAPSRNVRPAEAGTGASPFSARIVASMSAPPAEAGPVRIPAGGGVPPEAGTLRGELRLEAQLGRLRTFALSDEGSDRLFISGPAILTAQLKGSRAEPQVHAVVSLDEARLGVGEWLQKPAGVPARLRIDASAGQGEPTAHFALELAELHSQGSWNPSRGLEGETDWLPVGGLRSLLPVLNGWVEDGSVRVVFRSTTRERMEQWNVEFDGVTLGGRKIPVRVASLSGQGRLVDRRRFEASDLRADIGGNPLVLDLRVERALEHAGLRLRFRVRAPLLELSGLHATSNPAESPSVASDGDQRSELPADLRAAVERPIRLLREERAFLAQLELESGIVQAERVQCSDRSLSDLRIELGLRSRLLDVRRFSYRDADGAHRYQGHVNLKPLVPEVTLSDSLPAAAAIPPP